MVLVCYYVLSTLFAYKKIKQGENIMSEYNENNFDASQTEVASGAEVAKRKKPIALLLWAEFCCLQLQVYFILTYSIT